VISYAFFAEPWLSAMTKAFVQLLSMIPDAVPHISTYVGGWQKNRRQLQSQDTSDIERWHLMTVIPKIQWDFDYLDGSLG
jgi:hypothetical protein